MYGIDRVQERQRDQHRAFVILTEQRIACEAVDLAKQEFVL